MSAASPTDQHPLEMIILNAAFDAGGTIAMKELRACTPATGINIRKAINAQRNLGNLRQFQPADPITLTASARTAIAAGRAHRPMMTVTIPGRRVGKTAARMLREIAGTACLPAEPVHIEIACAKARQVGEHPSPAVPTADALAQRKVPGGLQPPSGTIFLGDGEVRR